MNSIKRIMIILVSATVLFGCNADKLKQLEQRNNELTAQGQLQDSLLNDFVGTFNQFEENLEMIKEKENLVAMNAEDPELRKAGKDKIVEDIQMINELLDQNRQIIDELTKKVDGSDLKIKEYRGLVARLKKQLEERDGDVTTLKTQLAEMNFTIENLNGRIDTLHQVAETLTQENELQTARITSQEEQIDVQTETIEEKTKKLNTAYFVMGSAKELKEKNILSKEGGFVGIGKASKLSDDFDASAFTKIDVTKLNTIPVSTKKAELLTNHPSDSYVFTSEDKTIESLEITNPDKFWKTSKYLVVVTN